jgi:hypothetical protein
MKRSKTTLTVGTTLALALNLGAADQAAAGGHCGKSAGYGSDPYRTTMLYPGGYRFASAPRTAHARGPMMPYPWPAWVAQRPQAFKSATVTGESGIRTTPMKVAAVSVEAPEQPASGQQTGVANADANVAEAKRITKAFAKDLKGALKTAIQSGGPVSAVEACNVKAPEIAAALSADSGWDVGRTSLKLRNPETNTPDVWEQAVLEKFEERKQAGEPVEAMAYTEIVETNGSKTFRFMKAIPTAEVCLACHGTDITPEVAAAIDRSYPNDQARGFKVGDIRGAFTLSKPL